MNNDDLVKFDVIKLIGNTSPGSELIKYLEYTRDRPINTDNPITMAREVGTQQLAIEILDLIGE